MFQGPLQEKFKVRFIADNSTMTRVNLDDLGGIRLTTAEFKGENTLIDYIRAKDNTDIVEFVASRTIKPSNPNMMIYKLSHLPSGKSMTSYFFKTT